MKDEDSVTKPKSWARRFVNVLLIAGISLAGLYCIGRLIWRFSGANQWELVSEGKGAQIYALKEPGTDLQQVKGRVRVHTTLNRAVAWLQDPDTCKEVRCIEPRTIARVDDQLQYVSMQMN